MGKNNGSTSSWLNAVKKAFRSPVKDVEKRCGRRIEENEQEDEEKKRGKRRWIFSKPLPLETTIQHKVANSPARDDKNGEIVVKKELKMDDSDIVHKRAIAVVTAAAATAQAAIEIIRLTVPSFTGKEQEAAVFIQSFFRGYLARRALQALKGVVKLQALIRGHNVRKRAKMTLQCIQSLVRVQAQVCDQRRRLSCESTTLGSMFNQSNNERKSINRNARRDEILDLIEKAKECSLKQGKTLAHALSQQILNLDEERFSDNNYEEMEGKHRCSSEHRNARNLCNQRDPIKTVEMDNSRPHSYAMSSPLLKKHHNVSVHSQKTPSSSSNLKSTNQAHSSSPSYKTVERDYEGAETPNLRANYYHRMSTSENACNVPRPKYMAATASAMARVRSLSVPRQRPSSPIREPTSAKKRLYFPVID